MKHTKTGNCFYLSYKCKIDGCQLGIFCDVCHQHSSPRGECKECSVCKNCEKNK